MKRPCSVCGTPRVVNGNSRTNVICHTCRRNGHSTRAIRTAEEQRAAWRRYQAARRAKGAWNTGGSHRRRARHYGVPYEHINPLEVFERDGWRCGICRRKVDKRLRAPHPMRASLDHIVPMYHGGGHTPTNVQCAHMRCNIAKRERGGGEQLLLIGDVA